MQRSYFSVSENHVSSFTPLPSPPLQRTLHLDEYETCVPCVLLVKFLTLLALCCPNYPVGNQGMLALCLQISFRDKVHMCVCIVQKRSHLQVSVYPPIRNLVLRGNKTSFIERHSMTFLSYSLFFSFCPLFLDVRPQRKIRPSVCTWCATIRFLCSSCHVRCMCSHHVWYVSHARPNHVMFQRPSSTCVCSTRVLGSVQISNKSRTSFLFMIKRPSYPCR